MATPCVCAVRSGYGVEEPPAAAALSFALGAQIFAIGWKHALEPYLISKSHHFTINQIVPYNKHHA